MNDAQERALGGLANLLLTAPETSIRFGAGELSMYRNIAYDGSGPGYLNGILSLLLNTNVSSERILWRRRPRRFLFSPLARAELVALF